MRQPIRIFSCTQKICLLFFLSFILSLRLYATDSTQVIHYTIDEGLPSSKVYSCLINRQGYLWFATEKGIVRYNGYDFRTYNAANAGLPDDDAYKINEDGFGRLWISTLTRHLGYIKNDRFHEVKLPGHAFYSVIYPDQSCVIGNNTIIKINSDSTYLLAVDLKGNVINYLSSNLHHSFFDDVGRNYLTNTGKLFIIDRGNRAYYFDLKLANTIPKKVSKLSFHWNNELRSHNFVLFYDSICIARNKEGVIATKIDLIKGTRVLIDLASKTGIAGDIPYSIPSEYKTPVLITDKHICTFDLDLNLISKESLQTSFFNKSQVSFKLNDISGDSWYTTTNDGILRLIKHKKLLQNIKPKLPDKIKNVGKQSDCLSMWCSTDQLILYMLTPDGSVKQAKLPEKNLLKYTFELNKDTIVLAYAHDFYFFDLKKNKQYKILADQGLFKVNDSANQSHFLLSKIIFWGIQNFVIKAQNMLSFSSALGTYTYSLKKDIGTAKRFTTERFSSGYYSRVLDRLLFYNTERIGIVNSKNYKYLEIPVSEFLNKEKLNTIKEDSFKNVFLLSGQNLAMVYSWPLKKQSIFTQFNLENVQLEVYKNNLVIAGRFGVAVAKILGKGKIGPFYITANTNEKLYKSISVLWVNEHNNIVLQTNKGWFQTNIDSVFTYGINQEKENTAKFSFALNFPNQQAIHEGDTLNIDQKDQRISIDAINFYGRGNVQYNYKINNPQWSQSATGEILLTSLKPDKYYKLQLTAKDDIWQSKTITTWIYVTPYWWQTSNWKAAFIIGGSVILILAILGIISITREAVIRANEKKRKLTDLELRAIHSQINPHFIFNTLSTALYFITRKDFDNAYDHVNKFSKLLRSYLKSSHDRFVLLSEEIEMLKRYIELQQTRFENRFDFKIYVENKVAAGDIQIPSLLLQPLVENAINHGVFHLKHKKGLLQIRFEQGKNATELICTVEDNGVGRDVAAAIRKESDADRQSYGSKLTEKLVEIFRQYEEMNIHIEYLDKPEPDSGTIVRLTISNVRYIGFED